LIAEDDGFQRLSLTEITEICEYDSVDVENGKLALEALRDPNNNFDLLLLDLQMPVMDGFELLTIMK